MATSAKPILILIVLLSLRNINIISIPRYEEPFIEPLPFLPIFVTLPIHYDFSVSSLLFDNI